MSMTTLVIGGSFGSWHFVQFGKLSKAICVRHDQCDKIVGKGIAEYTDIVNVTAVFKYRFDLDTQK